MPQPALRFECRYRTGQEAALGEPAFFCERGRVADAAPRGAQPAAAAMLVESSAAITASRPLGTP
jgi:hypothetical protein